jgi:sugar lactone lactonase YvrE
MTPTTVLTGLCFGEGPRWHDGRLYLSDMHDHRVLAVTTHGDVETIVTVDHWPSGLGWTPAGDLLIVSMTDRRLLRYDGSTLTEVANLAGLASFHCNDMVVDQAGRAYIGNFGFDLHGAAPFKAAELVRVDPDGTARIVARDMAFPNGTVITPDGRTLIVGESYAGRLTAFDVERDGALSNRRIWAQLPQGTVPDGICLDAQMGIWVASPTTNECLRVESGGQVSHRVALDRGAFACMLGGVDRRTLYILTASSSDPATCRRERGGRIEAVAAPYPGAGLP